MLRKHRRGWNDEEREKAAHIFGRLLDEIPISAEDIRGLFDRPESWAELDRIDRMETKLERSNDAEVAAAAPDRPKQIGVLFAARGNESYHRPIPYPPTADCRS